MSMLFLASLAFLVTHLGVSSTPLRGVLIDSLGENAYLGVYSLLAFLTLGAMIYAWVGVGQTDIVWSTGLAGTAVARAVMPVALILLVAGLMAKNPTAVKQAAAVNQEIPGILKITRHPVQWGFLLWAVAHLIANGDQASIVFFGTFAILSGAGTVAMDKRHRARQDPAWQTFYGATSNLPFAAIAAGRTQFRAGDLSWPAVGIGIVMFVVLYIFHDLVSGVALY